MKVCRDIEYMYIIVQRTGVASIYHTKLFLGWFELLAEALLARELFWT